MPGLDGPGLYQEVARGHPELGRRFIFLSGDSHEPSARAFLQRTDVPTIEKPFAGKDLRRTVDEVLCAADRDSGRWVEL
jgi:hypothetical protein